MKDVFFPQSSSIILSCPAGNCNSSLVQLWGLLRVLPERAPRLRFEKSARFDNFCHAPGPHMLPAIVQPTSTPKASPPQEHSTAGIAIGSFGEGANASAPRAEGSGSSDQRSGAATSDVGPAHDVNRATLPLVSEAEKTKKKNARAQNSFNSDGQQYMNIHHFEQLMVTFHQHKNEDGSSGFDIDKFREVFGKVLGGNLSYDQMTMLFMKIDANSDGTVDWDEFSTYMMMGQMENHETMNVIDEKIRKLISGPHKDMIKRIDFIAKERKYITVSREGTVCIWSLNLKLQRVINTKEFSQSMSWVADSVFMHDHGKLVIITDDRELCIFDVLSIKPRMIARISQLDNNPLCLAYSPHYDEEGDLILFGDDGGYVNVLNITRKFLFDSSSDSEALEQLTPAKLLRKDSARKNNISFYRRKIHNEWVLKVQYYQEMNSFVSCASENTKSLVIGDLERKTVRYIHVPKGIKCFDFCRRPSFLVTGGRDKIIRLWNPYVLSKPAGSLHGHNTGIVSLIVNHEESHLISLSEDKAIKIWNVRNLNCLQTLMDKIPHRPENIISAIFFDSVNRQLLTGSNKLETWPLYKNLKHAIARSHDAGVVSAMFNENFHQVVSGCQNSNVSIWDLASGDKIFQFFNAHGKFEITSMCFDRTGRRLITGSRDGIVKMWNFNNGQILRKMIKDSTMEVTDVIYVEMGSNRFIVAVGWDRKITIFVDDASHFETEPVRIMNGAGWGAHRGHEDDISSVTFCPPNILATSSIDGVIVVWNLESGYIKTVLREPFLDLRSKEEKVVEKILFLQNPDRMNQRWHKIPLISCHADGFLRFWDVYDGSMVFELNCQVTEDEGLTTLATNTEGNLLLVGGSKGHVRIFDVKNFVIDSRKDFENQCTMKIYWRSHIQAVASVNYVNTQDVVLTSAKDGTVRVWTVEGIHIGIFGQDVPWVIGDPSTYQPVPTDVRQESVLEKQRNQILSKHKEVLKKSVIETWKGISDGLGDENEADLSEKLLQMRQRAIQSHLLKKWREHCHRKKTAEDWALTSELMTIRNQKRFFAYDASKPSKPKRPQFVKAKHDAVFHMLHCYPLTDIPSLNVPKKKGTKY
ncbi:WD40-repeat-containing domain protein [Zopfochytrium polystomum]|nr:WD40-repeat-containing domain protein [Zopfochytrium polystomum]